MLLLLEPLSDLLAVVAFVAMVAGAVATVDTRDALGAGKKETLPSLRPGEVHLCIKRPTPPLALEEVPL